MLSQKRRQYFVYYRAFWQRRCRAAAAGAVLKLSGGNYAVLPKEKSQDSDVLAFLGSAKQDSG